MRSRDLRRHLAERAKRRVRWHYRYWKHQGPQTDPRLLGIHARTRTPCSCWMCGNPRKYWKGAKTRQEQQAQDAQQIED